MSTTVISQVKAQGRLKCERFVLLRTSKMQLRQSDLYMGVQLAFRNKMKLEIFSDHNLTVTILNCQM